MLRHLVHWQDAFAQGELSFDDNVPMACNGPTIDDSQVDGRNVASGPNKRVAEKIQNKTNACGFILEDPCAPGYLPGTK